MDLCCQQKVYGTYQLEALSGKRTPMVDSEVDPGWIAGLGEVHEGSLIKHKTK